MARQKRPPADVAARRERVWEATCRGLTTRQIAAQEKVDHKQIVRDLAAIDEERRQEHEAEKIARREAAANLSRSRYRLVIREALAEWERSKLDKQRQRSRAKQKTIKLGPDGKPDPIQAPDETEAEESTEGRLGDPAYLRAVVAAQTRLDEIDGIDAPKRLEHSGPDGGPISHESHVDDQRAELAGILAALRQRSGNGQTQATPAG